MPSTGFKGVHKLTAATIDRVVTQTSPGAYVLTKHDPSDTFTVSYVGRSDADLNSRLKDHAAAGKYTHFKAGYHSTAKAAFQKECQLYHDFGGSDSLDNKAHPARPKNTSHSCPVADCDDLD